MRAAGKQIESLEGLPFLRVQVRLQKAQLALAKLRRPGYPDPWKKIARTWRRAMAPEK